LTRAEESSELSKAHSDMQEPNTGEGAHGRVRQLLAELKCKSKPHRRQKQGQATQEKYINFA